MKKYSKKSYYQDQLFKYKGNIKKPWGVIKEVFGKSKVRSNFPNRVIVKNKEVTNKLLIAENFNEFFANIGPELASKIPQTKTHFSFYIDAVVYTFQELGFNEKEFETAFFELKRNKSCGPDNKSVNVVIDSYEEIKTPLIHIFNLCFKEGIFPRKLRIGKITPGFKKGDSFLLTNYRPITIPPCFSKILERLMYNELYTYLTENNTLFNLQFGFRCQHSTEHATVELVDKILNGFSEEKYTLGIFIDLSKAFDTVDHQILLKKINLYGVKGKSLEWFESYLSERKQYIEVEGQKTSF